MPPKQRITREMILERAFAMFCQEGMEAVNARSVAKALNCSTQPIFSYYSGMEDLKSTLDAKAHALFDDALKAALAVKGNPVDVCCAYLRFACEQPRLFAHLFLRAGLDGRSLTDLAEMDAALLAGVRSQIADEQKSKDVCASLLVYAHGLSALAATQGKSYDDDEAHAKLGAMLSVLCA